MIKFSAPCNVSASSIEWGILTIHREYGPVNAGDLFVVIVGMGHGAPAQRAVDEPGIRSYRFKLVIMPPHLWPNNQWVITRDGNQGVWSEGV